MYTGLLSFNASVLLRIATKLWSNICATYSLFFSVLILVSSKVASYQQQKKKVTNFLAFPIGILYKSADPQTTFLF